MKEAITSALRLLVILFCFSLTTFSVLLFFRPDWRLVGVDWLLHCPEKCLWMSAAFACVGIFFALSFYLLERGRILRISMGHPGVAYDRKILNTIINDFFSTHFPQTPLKADIVFLPKDEIELLMEFPPLTKSEREELLQSIEQQLTLLLHERLGYDKAFTLSLKH